MDEEKRNVGSSEPVSDGEVSPGVLPEAVASSADEPADSMPADSAISAADTSQPAPDLAALDAAAPGPASFCSQCGSPLSAGQAFCPACGASVNRTQPSAFTSLATPGGAAVSRKVSKKLVAIIAAAVVVIVALAVFVIPEVTASPDDLFERGKYARAYDKSDDADKAAMIRRIAEAGEYDTAFELAADDEKHEVVEAAIDAGLFEKAFEFAGSDEADVKAVVDAAVAAGEFELAYDRAAEADKQGVLEAIIATGDYALAYRLAPSDQQQLVALGSEVATMCGKLKDNLKDPESFQLRNIWCAGPGESIVLEVSANNSVGGRVSNYYYYTYDADEKEYGLYVSLSDLDDEKTYSFDTSSEKLEKLLKNAARHSVIEIMSDDANEAPSCYVDAVNALNEAGALESVESLLTGETAA